MIGIAGNSTDTISTLCTYVDGGGWETTDEHDPRRHGCPGVQARFSWGVDEFPEKTTPRAVEQQAAANRLLTFSSSAHEMKRRALGGHKKAPSTKREKEAEQIRAKSVATESAPEESPIALLPCEILQYIFGFLDLKQLIQAQVPAISFRIHI